MESSTPRNSKDSKFSLADLKKFDIREEPGQAQEMRVVKLEVPETPTVAEFQVARIRKPGEGDYAHTKARFGPLAATDPDRKAGAAQKFSINALLREPLNVEQEERRAIEARVQTTVAELAVKAKEEAAQVGYRDGLAKGHEEAFLQFKQEAEARMKNFEALMKELETAREEILRANEKFLINLILRISRMVILRELKTDTGYIQRLAMDLIERVGVRENIKLRISPDDSHTLGMIKDGIEKSLGAMKNLSIEVDSKVPQGGCSIETQWNAIDADIDHALEGIAQSLIGSSSGSSGGAPAEGVGA